MIENTRYCILYRPPASTLDCDSDSDSDCRDGPIVYTPIATISHNIMMMMWSLAEPVQRSSVELGYRNK